MNETQQRQRVWLPAICLALLVIGFGWFSRTGQVAHGVTPASASVTSPLSANTIPSNNWAFPHVTLYGGGASSGWPFTGNESDLQATEGAPLNPDVIADYGRFPMIIIPITPSGDSRPDIFRALRQYNPAQKIFAYVHSTGVWCPSINGHISYADNVFYRNYYLDATFGDTSCSSQSNGLLWSQDGSSVLTALETFGLNVNLAHRINLGNNQYQYDLAEALATTIYSYANPTNGFDGIFLDVFCPSISWIDPTDVGHLYNSPNNIDYVKAGYGVNSVSVGGVSHYINDQASHDAFHLGWEAGHQRFAEKLRELAIADGQPNFVISGNCAQAPTRLHSVLNGWMREGYPKQNTYAGAADFYSNMFAWPWGYLHQDVNFRSPQYNFIFPPAKEDYTDTNGNRVFSPYNAINQRIMRFGVGSATLGNGSVEFHDGSGDPKHGLWYQWWYDEYGVRTDLPSNSLQYGQAIKDAQHTEWLGMPLGPAYAQPSITYAAVPNLVSLNTSFETAGPNPQTIPSWSTYTHGETGNSIERDPTTATEGTASLKATVTTADTNASWYLYAYTGAFPVTANAQYTVTFWAKGSENLPLTITLGAGTTNAIQTLRIDDTWRQYQAVIRSTTSVGSTSVQFQFSLQAGTYWIDDVHVQLGATGVWRRDFDHGTVLVNPTNTDQTVILEKPFQRIRGIVNTSLNDGSVVTQVSIPGTNTGAGIGDSAFLLSLDLTAPVWVQNLSAF